MSLEFKIKKDKYYNSVFLNRSRIKKPKIKYFQKVFQDIENKGICFIPNFLSKKNINKINEELKPYVDKLLNNSLSKLKYYRNTEEGIMRLYNISKFSPTSKLFFQSYLIRNFAKYYISKNVSFYQDMVEIRQKLKLPLKDLKLTSDKFHFDDWRIRLKFFLLLTKVGLNNSPMKYIPKSHKIDKFSMENDLYINKKNGRYGFYKNHEVKRLIKSNNLKIINCTGNAGTLIIVNTNGIHKGTPLVDPKNPRLQLGLYSDLREKKWNPKNINI